jgi:hypothetical protein
MRIVLAAAIVAGFGGFANAQNEANKDRPGSDISVQDIGNNPNLCRQNCDAVANCRAWTFVKPGIQGPSAKCYLKNPVPAQVNNNCCTSGVKLSGPVPAGAASGADRPGSDISSSNLATPNPTLCKNLCDGNANCKAWTFVKPGIQGPQARCYQKNPIPAQVANNCCISGVKLPPPPAPIPPGAQANRDRPGSDFNNIALAVADPALCQNACNSVAQCLAWTFVKPGVQGPNARCYLKNAVPAAVVNNCCVSGVKSLVYVLPPGATNNRDRPGNDYANFAVADPQICKNACDGQAQCTAWTFVRPGVQGPQARCYLKQPTPAQVVNNCCISGVKASDPVPPGANNNRDRPGNDFQSFVPPSQNAIHCKNACDGNVNCMAWTYVRPGFQGPQARCYLKNPTPPQVVNTCCISGVKAAPPPPPAPAGPFEANINRPGGDYADFGGAANSALLCFGACALQPQCKAWTFVKPGFQGPLARCWLKNVVPPPVADVCCTSGAKP